jgi:dephospho-CoA kinase
MKKIGITGQMGSGKTFIAMKFASLGVPILVMDQVVKQLQTTNSHLIKKIKKRFPGSYTKSDQINKEFMVRTLFYDESGQSLKDISEIIKPFLMTEINNFYSEHEHKTYVLVESALIYEYNLENLFDEIIFVNSNSEVRKKMAMKRDGISSKEYDLRMKSQLSDEYKIKNSNWIINNDYTDEVENQIKSIHESLLQKNIL